MEVQPWVRIKSVASFQITRDKNKPKPTLSVSQTKTDNASDIIVKRKVKRDENKK